MTKHGVWWLLGSCLAVAPGGGALAGEGAAALATAHIGRAPDAPQVRQRMSALAVPFEANAGQQDARVAFTARTLGGTLFVTRVGGLVYSFPGKPVAGQGAREAVRKRGPGWVLTETLVDARPVVRGDAPSTTRVSRFIGNDPSRWQSSVPTFERVALGEAWPGIEVVLAARGNTVEKLFTVAPGTDVRRIVIRLDGAERLELAGDGALVASTGNGPVSFTAPRAWQDIKGERKPVRVAYTLAGDRYGFRLHDYDSAHPVVIDPIVQSTYLGGSGYDGAHGIAVDPAGNVFVTGYTQSGMDFPVTTGGPQQSFGGGAFDAFVAKFDNTLTLPPIQVTYLGGSGIGNEEGRAVAVNPASGDVYVAGTTTSVDFPFAGSGVQPSNGGGSDGFVAKLDNTLTTIRTTYLGGSGSDVATAIVVANATNGDVFVTGYTSGNFPVTAGASQFSYGGGIHDAFVAKLDSNLATTLTATYLGGNGDDEGNAIALDPSGFVLVAGQTKSTTGFPGVGGGAQSSNGGSNDAFVARLSPALAGTIQATYFGGSGDDRANGIAVDPTNGDVFVVGNTTGNLPAAYTANGAQATSGGGPDAFVAKLKNSLSGILNATYLGGIADDYGSAIALDSSGNVFVAGMTRSPNFPQTAGGAQPNVGGVSYNSFVARLNNGLLVPITQATYLGTGLEDELPSLALDGNNFVFVAGHTSSTNFPFKAGGAQSNYGGGGDAYVAKLTRGLHGAPYTATNDGDPHITTVEGIHYDFQSAGEFTVLRDGNALEIQTRQAPVTTQPPVADAYSGLATCVSLNTAVAARVGTHRVTYQPNSRRPGSGGMQLRVDGVLTTLGAQPINLGPQARVMKSAIGNGIEIDFPDGTNLTATTNFWGPPHNRWYINLSVFGTEATEGVMGKLASGSWLPALPDGSSLGPMPAASQRYGDLYGKFADAWRVTNATSLFDYAPGTSTATFTNKNWPPENPPCVAPESPPTKPLDANTAQRLCGGIVDKNRKADCVFDVGITGEPGFARLYLISQQIQAGATRTTVDGSKNPTRFGEAVTFTATVAPRGSSSKGIPSGTVQFTLDGTRTGNPVRLNAKGQAVLSTSRLAVGIHRVGALYLPATSSAFLASSSFDRPHAVGGVAQNKK